MTAASARVFVGRSRELAELEAALREARAGRGQLCLITGEAGIGKTRLAEEIALRADAARVLWGRCWEGGGAPGYWPWIQVLRRLADEADALSLREQLGDSAPALARVVPELATSSLPRRAAPENASATEQMRFALFDAIAALLRRAAARQPLVLVLDDLHATDVPSLLLLEFAARELRDAAVLLVGTYRERDGESDPARAAVLARTARLAHRLALGGWDEGDVARFVEQAFQHAPAPALTSAVHRVTEGNPFYVVEFLRQVSAEHSGTLPSELPPLASIPSGVRHSIRARLEVLQPSCRRALAVAAVIGREFDLDLLAAATNRRHDELRGDLGHAELAGVVVTLPSAAPRWVFRHGLIRTTLYDDLPAAERTRLHRLVGQAPVQLHGGDPSARLAETAHHFLRGAAPGDTAVALDYAVRAARQAVDQTAYEDAAARYEDVLTLLGPEQPANAAARGELLVELGKVQARTASAAGRPAFQRAAAAARAAGDAGLLARAALGFAERGLGVPHHLPDRDAVALLEEALAATPDADGILRVRLLARLAVEMAVSEDRTRGEALSAAAVAMARRLDDRAALAHALSARSFVLWRWDDADDRPAIAAEVIRLAELQGDADLELQGRIWLMFDLVRAGEAQRLDAQIARYLPLAERLRHPRYLWLAENLAAMRALWRADLSAAEAHAQRALDVSARVDDLNARLGPFVQRFAVRLEQGRIDEQEAFARLAAERTPDSPVPRTFLARLLIELGQLDEARRLLDSLAREDFRDLHRDRRISVLPYLAEVCAAVGDARRAAQLSELLSPLADSNIPYGGATLCFGYGAHYLGLLAETRGQLDAAIAQFDIALVRHARMDAPICLTQTQLACARALRSRAGRADRERSDRLVADALVTAHRLGLQRIAAHAERLAQEVEPEPHRARQAIGYEGGGVVPADDHAAAVPSRRVLAFPDRGRRSRGSALDDHPARHGVFRREGEFWAVGDGTALVRLKDSKGLRFLALLLRQPGRELHVTQLVALERGGVEDPDTATAACEPGLSVGRGVDALPALDAKAKAAYKRRLEDLRDTLDEATRFNDLERAARARTEIELLGRELARGVGLRGRNRNTGAFGERARLNVTRTIADAVKRITAQDPALGRLFATTIKTGAFCSYTPDPRFPIDWRL